MEDQNRFDLEMALTAWRQDCASRPGISLEDAKELESDLRERVADLAKQGLTDREAFGSAVRQMGSPRELAREFARENPLPVWRERFLWMILACFVVSVWGWMTGGVLLWFVNVFGVLLPLSGMAWLQMAGNVPVLAVAVLLATGRLERLTGRLAWILQSRQRLGLAGAAFLLASMVVRLFGPSPLQLPKNSLMGLLYLLSADAGGGQLLLLSLSIILLRPASAGESARPVSTRTIAPKAVWRERVFWMAVGGLAVGFWQRVSMLGITAMFYTGDINRPYGDKALLLACVYLLIQLSPLFVLGFFLRQRMRLGRAFAAETPFQNRLLFPLVPFVVCVWWVGTYLLSNYLWRPRGIAIAWSDLLVQYAITFQWLWPVGLTALVLWLAPRQAEWTPPENQALPG